jgi:hypothetical protein
VTKPPERKTNTGRARTLAELAARQEPCQIHG